MKKFFDVEIDGQVELENGKTLGELKESSISITDPDVSGCGGGGFDANIVHNNELHRWEFTKGSYADVMEKIMNGEAVLIGIFETFTGSSGLITNAFVSDWVQVLGADGDADVHVYFGNDRGLLLHSDNTIDE